MDAVLRSGIILVIVLGTVPCGARAQLFETHLPYVQNEAAGTGYVGSEVAGGSGARPAIAFATPTAYGAEFGDLFGAVGYQRFLRRSIPKPNDGVVFMGGGVGDARRTVGLELTYGIYDLVGEPFSDGGITLKIHRRLYKGLAVAVGVENVIRYGEWIGKSAYGVVSHTVSFRRDVLTGVSVTVGMGDGRFNSVTNLSQGTNGAGLFGGLSVEFADRASIYGTWYGQDLNLGASFVVPGPLPLTLTPVWVSVLDKHVLGDRVALSVGARYQFR